MLKIGYLLIVIQIRNNDDCQQIFINKGGIGQNQTLQYSCEKENG